jgi:hypothetical protein
MSKRRKFVPAKSVMVESPLQITFCYLWLIRKFLLVR